MFFYTELPTREIENARDKVDCMYIYTYINSSLIL